MVLMNYRPKLDDQGRMKCCVHCLKRGTVEYLNTDLECTHCLALIEPYDVKTAPPCTREELDEAMLMEKGSGGND